MTSPALKSVPKVAVVGIACRFPGAADVEAYWRNLCNGTESISRFDELAREPAHGAAHSQPSPGERVLAGAVLDGIELFDHGLFGFSRQEAAIADPQHRVGLEVALQCLIDAGCDPRRFAGDIGVFTGCSLSTYLVNQLLPDADRALALGGLPLLMRNDKDHLALVLAYKLGLTGAAVNVGSSCSSGLLAVNVAVNHLLTQQCDMALCGAASILVPQHQGHYAEAGGIYSRDGHCRVFDARASGTVGGSGVGFLALKRYDDAVRANDRIRAVILGSAANNDGSAKAGYTAPSAAGQASVIATAHGVAGVDARSITMIEAHGTGTVLGDPIEFEALNDVFRRSTGDTAFCALGSVKSNIGHLDAAAGIAGLIKAVLAVERGAIPPTLHYTAPNPHIPIAGSPFFVNTTLRQWPSLRRAGVSAFGMGGTNVHVVLEEPPALESAPAWRRSHYLLPVTAHDDAAVALNCEALAGRLRRAARDELAGAAFSLATSRPHFARRRALIAAAPQGGRTELAAVPVSEGMPAVVVVIAAGVEAYAAFAGEAGFARRVATTPCSLEDAGASRNLEAGTQIGWAWLNWLQHLGIRPDAILVDGRVSSAPTVLLAPDIPRAVRTMDAGGGNARWLDSRGLPISDIASWLKALTGGRSQCMFDPGNLMSAPGAGNGSRGPADEEASESYARWLGNVATLWQAGLAIDWSAFYAGSAWYRGTPPAYEFTRTRCWFQPRLPERALPALPGLLPALEDRYRDATKPGSFRPMSDFGGLEAHLDAKCRWYLFQALQPAFGNTPCASSGEVAERIGLDPKHRRMLAWSLTELSRCGVLSLAADRWTIVEAPHLPANAGSGKPAIDPQFADLDAIVDVFGAALGDHLRSPTAGRAMFGAVVRDGSLERALTKPSVPFSSMDACCRTVAALTRYLGGCRPGARILEVGAGGLILTQFMRSLLEDELVEYVVTDVDDAQVARARALLNESGLPLVRTARLDITRNVAEQGFAQPFDLIVGLNALHACADIDAALGELRAALGANGMLAVVESVRPSLWQTLIWGWADGWWDCADFRNPIAGPLLDLDTWQRSIAALYPDSLVRFPSQDAQGADTALFIAQFSSPLRMSDVRSGIAVPEAEPDASRWLYRPCEVTRAFACDATASIERWCVLDDGSPQADTFARRLELAGSEVVKVRAGAAFRRTAWGWELRPTRRQDWAALVDALAPVPGTRIGILHLWTLQPSATSAHAHSQLSLYALLAAAQGIGDGHGARWHIVAVVRGLCDLDGSEPLEPLHALTRAAAKIVPTEYSAITCRVVDIGAFGEARDDAGWRRLLDLVNTSSDDVVVAWRGGNSCRVTEYQRLDLASLAVSAGFRERGRYVIFGGLGGLGMAVAERLARRFRARLLLAGRNVDHARMDAVRALKAWSPESDAVACDITDQEAVRAALAEADRRFGGIDGIIHAAGTIDDAGAIARREVADTERAIAAKVEGALNLERALRGRTLDFLVLFSSVGSVLYKLKYGEVGYVAGNDFLVSFAAWHGRRVAYPTQVIQWTDWTEAGMYQRSRSALRATYAMTDAHDVEEVLRPITPDEGFAALDWVVRSREPHVVVCRQPLEELLRMHASYGTKAYGALLDRLQLRRVGAAKTERHPTGAAAAGDDSRSILRSIWSDVIGEEVGEDDDFFKLGGDSLLALRVISRARQLMDVELPLDVFFTSPVLRDMAARVDVLREAKARA